MQLCRPLQVALLMLLALGTAISVAQETRSPAQAQIAEGDQKRPVSLLLGWRANGTFAPAFLAEEKGYFADEGLTVDIQEGGPGRGVELLANGQKDFLLGGVDSVPLGAQAGMDLRAVAVIAQSDPSVIVVLSKSDIQMPADLKGKTIAVVEGGGPATLLPSFLAAVGIDPSAVTITNMSRDVITSAFLAGRVDATTEFATDGLIQILSVDPDVRYWLYRDYGVSVLSMGIITAPETIDNRPDVVRGVVRAILRAYAYAEDKPEEAVAAAAKHYPEALSDQALHVQRLRRFAELMHSTVTEKHGLGYSTDEQWQSMLEILAKHSGLKDVRTPSHYYTNEFLPAASIK